MASVFDTVLAGTPLTTQMSLFGEDIAYTPQGGVEKTIKGVPHYESRTFISMGSSELDHEEMEWDIRGDSDTLGELTPKEFGEEGNSGDSFTHDSTTWYVAELLNRKAAGGYFRLRCKTKRIADAQEG